MSITAGLLTDALWKVVTMLVRSKIFWYTMLASSVIGWYKWTNWTIDNLRHVNAKQKQQIEILDLSLQKAHEQYGIVRENLKVVEKEKTKSTGELESLRKAIFRENQKKKSLEELALKKTKLIESKINNATRKTIKCIEQTSGGKSCEG